MFLESDDLSSDFSNFILFLLKGSRCVEVIEKVFFLFLSSLECSVATKVSIRIVFFGTVVSIAFWIAVVKGITALSFGIVHMLGKWSKIRLHVCSKTFPVCAYLVMCGARDW